MLEVRLLHVEISRKNAELKTLFDQVVAERQRSERMALAVPPDSIAARLRARPDVTEESLSDVTVLIADVVGFTELTPPQGPARLTGLLEELFAAFDDLARDCGLRKVKTLGNSYMAAAGVPVPADDHAAQAAQLAREMMGALEKFNGRTGSSLQVRIGIASGSVVAAVIGKRQYLYDLWGDAVAIAARMESHGVAGRVQLAASTQGLLAESFALEERGALEVEGMGEVQTWFMR
jgi:adenylate cyclase